MKIDWAIFQERRCLFCLKPFHKNTKSSDPIIQHVHTHLCPECAEYFLEKQRPHYPLCGHHYQDTNAKNTPCGTCLQHGVIWDSFTFIGEYKTILQDFILKAKFSEHRAITKFLGELLALTFYEKFKHEFNPYYSLDILPMPLHTKRLHERGYNQCLEIAKFFTKHLQKLAPQISTTIHKQILQKSRHTTPQMTLGKKERQTNIKNSFFVQENTLHKVLLLDDVATTNSTLTEVCKVLKKSGISHIDILVLAKA